tara:strand:+ start:308 stop:577 length:270 start_codon:yes stop_codon:yes gene_type:complete
MTAARKDLHFGWDVVREKAKKEGLVIWEDWVKDYDARFKKMGLDQVQFTQLMLEYVTVQAYLWSPETYKWYQRIGLAYHFLFRKGPPCA